MNYESQEISTFGSTERVGPCGNQGTCSGRYFNKIIKSR